MAITGSRDNPRPTEMLNATAGRIAAALSIALGLAGIGINVYYLMTLGQPSGPVTAAVVVKIAVLTLVCIAGLQLIRGRIWAQQLLLVVWLAGLIFVVGMAAAGMLWGVPKWWGIKWSMAEVLVPIAVLLALAVAMLLWASKAETRVRYATNVALAIAAAVALIVVINMFSQTAYARRNLEALQRFSLSQRTKRILQATDQEIRLTCVYTATKNKPETADRRRRVMEFMREMREHNKSVEFENVTTDAQKAELVERLREKLVGSAGKHDEFLRDFQTESEGIVEALGEQQQRWEQAGGGSYLDQWGLTPEVARLLKTGRGEFQRIADKVNAELTGTGLPNYQRLVTDVKNQLTTASETMAVISRKMKEVSEVAPNIETNKDSALKTAAVAEAAVKEALRILGAVGEVPAEPGAVLEEFAPAADKAIRALRETVMAMRQIAGKQHAGLINASQVWVAQTAQRRVMLPMGAMIMQRRDTIPDLYEYAAANLTRWKLEATAARQAANVEHQGKAVQGLGKAVTALQESLRETRSSAEKAIRVLSTVDKPTRRMLQGAASGEAFRKIAEPVEKLLAIAKELPDLEADTISDEMTRDNIVIVEAGDKTEVVNFETVWPMQFRPTGMVELQGPEKRSFDGDSAISSKILSMTNEPFATVVMTYYRPEVSAEMRRMLPRARISPDNLNALTDRLKEANFEVEQWNLTEDRPEATEDRPQVLLVLPPADIPGMSIPGQSKPAPFGQEHLDKLRKAIDEGTPAIFLAGFEPPRRVAMFGPIVSPPYLLGKYLEEDWGVEVLTDYLIVPTIADPDKPGKMKIDLNRLSYFPLSSFTDHVIGRNLQGQRMLWQELAVIRKARDVPESVTIESLLTVAGSMRNTWASRRVRELVAQFQTQEGSFISPDYEAGDIAAPFDVAVVATRPGTEDIQPARIAVMGLGAGLRDGFVNERVGVISRDGGLSLSDSPRANPDVVINSVYWLIGLERYIARGPAQIKPIAMIPPETLTALRLLCVAGLPLVALGLGGVVLFVRRR